LLSSTQVTSMSLPLTKGHTYSFTVSALDAAGTPTAISQPVTFAVKP
jgi:hypothetical protein